MSEKAIAALGTDVERLADEYEMDARLVARVCDERLDKSGALLGRVRAVVRKRGKSGGYPLAPAHTLDLDSPETVERLARLDDAIAGERRDWHAVEVRPDDLAFILAALREGGTA